MHIDVRHVTQTQHEEAAQPKGDDLDNDTQTSRGINLLHGKTQEDIEGLSQDSDRLHITNAQKNGHAMTISSPPPHTGLHAPSPTHNI